MRFSLRTLLAATTALCIAIGGYRFLFATYNGLKLRAVVFADLAEPNIKSLLPHYTNPLDSSYHVDFIGHGRRPEFSNVSPEELSLSSHVLSHGSMVTEIDDRMEITYGAGATSYGLIIGKLPYWAREHKPRDVEAEIILGPFAKAEHIRGDTWIVRREE